MSELVAPSRQSGWTGSWYSPVINSSSFRSGTIHTVVQLTTGGDRLRLRFSNQYGRTALKIGAVRVALGEDGQDISFNGQSQLILQPGEAATSDPVSFATIFGTRVTISVYYPDPIPIDITQQAGTADSNLYTPGNTVQTIVAASEAQSLAATYFLTGVDVETANSRGTIAVMADSNTGGGSSKWPALLAQRLAEAGKNYGVLNAAIGGNRILRDSRIPYGGEKALDRFDRDALDQPGVRYVLVYEGINDIGVNGMDGSETPYSASAAEVIGGLKALADRAHERGVKIYVATFTPIEGMPPDFYSPSKDEARKAVNAWIRTSREIDGYLEFEQALADPREPGRIKRDFDFAAHPNDAGQRALSEAIDLSIFE